MSKALLSLKRSCGLVLRLWHICIACALVVAVALGVHLAQHKNLGHRSRLHTSALLSYVGLSSGQQQDLEFRTFPVNKTQIDDILKSIYSNCLADEEELLRRTDGLPQMYRVRPVQDLSPVLPARGCMLHGLLQHCPVSQRGQALRRSRHILREEWQAPSGERPALMDMASSLLQRHSSLFQPQITADMVLRALQRGFMSDTFISPEMYKQGARNWGDPTRLQHFFRKLLHGDLVKVVAVGGSVTTGMGARYANESYVQRIHAWLQSLGSEDDPVHIEFTNSAVSATTSSYTSQCVGDFVPEDADLVLVEFSVNDWETVDPAIFTWMDNSLRRGFERLLRKLLRLKNEPALLVLHWWAPLYFRSSFWNVAEDELDVIASYYRLQSISFRDAFYTSIMADRPGFRLEDIFCDIVHPNAVGHRLFAELVVLQLQEVLAGLLLAPVATDTWLQAMPPPLFRGNEASGRAVCLKGNALQSAIVGAQGDWKWVDEAKEGAQQAKWGMVSTRIGDELLLRIDHSKRQKPALLGQALLQGEPKASVVVGLGLLKSYRDVGAAVVSCSGGCTCNQTRFELLHEHQVSQVYWFYIFVTLSPRQIDCQMSVTVAAALQPNGVSKVKVTSLMVSEDDRAENRKMFTVLNTTDAEGNNSG